MAAHVNSRSSGLDPSVAHPLLTRLLLLSWTCRHSYETRIQNYWGSVYPLGKSMILPFERMQLLRVNQIASEWTCTKLNFICGSLPLWPPCSFQPPPPQWSWLAVATVPTSHTASPGTVDKVIGLLGNTAIITFVVHVTWTTMGCSFMLQLPLISLTRVKERKENCS